MRGSRSARTAHPSSPAGGGRAAAAAKRDAELEQLNAWRTTMTMLKDRLVELEEEKTAWDEEKAVDDPSSCCSWASDEAEETPPA